MDIKNKITMFIEIHNTTLFMTVVGIIILMGLIGIAIDPGIDINTLKPNLWWIK